jgi:hypothetical protein
MLFDDPIEEFEDELTLLDCSQNTLYSFVHNSPCPSPTMLPTPVQVSPHLSAHTSRENDKKRKYSLPLV